jgi:acylglycerol lipase
MVEEDFTSLGGLRIHMRSWASQGAPRAVVVICHGVNSHGGQYLWTGEQLAAAGFAAYAVDLRGRGRSEGERFYVEDIAEYVADVRGLIAIARERHPTLPLYLLGHSAGGVVSCALALDHQDEIDGLICESFAFQVPAPGFVLTAIKGPQPRRASARSADLAHEGLHPRSGGPEGARGGSADQGRDPAGDDRRRARPRRRAAARLLRADHPLLIMHGTDDKATVCRGSEYFYEHAGSPDKTLKLYQGHYHDLLNDLGKEAVLADIVGWIDARLPASAKAETAASA